MIVVMKGDANERDIQNILERVKEAGLSGHLSQGVERTVIGVIGVSSSLTPLAEALERQPGVETIVRITKPFKLTSREFQSEDTIVQVGNVAIGGANLVVMAGPCAVEDEQQTIETALAVKEAGAHVLRGGAYKPRTSPYSFRGHGPAGLEILARAKEASGLPVVTEVMSPGDVPTVAQYADILQVGARNMQNFILLDEVGRIDKPVLLKRGLSATIEEWLLSAEYIMAQGNRQVILCERGIRTFETYTRNTFDVSSIPVVEKLSHLPVLSDPSHGTGKWYLVKPVALAAIAAGTDGLLIEVHPHPDRALSDGPQSLTFENFRDLMQEAAKIAKAVGRPFLKTTAPIHQPA
ncbi:MAG: 3-deoxy-7-phosphoheptulonate synthase [Chloroflexi bacterium]|nr:3-deoxy-7-phosphoheptulonate synthase [Chloroflexota bacterium]